jgi:hypothetical protein
MTAGEHNAVALYDKERRGILIHPDLLKGGPFSLGDRFTIYPRPAELFSLTLIRDDHGEFFFDRFGIFIARSRRIDMLLGGIFERYALFLEPQTPGTLKLRPLEMVQDRSQGWW